MEHERGAGALDQALVGLEVARVGGQILVRRELDGVEEHADHHAVVFGDGALDQALMAFVQVPHGGDQTNAEPFGLPLADDLLGLFDGGCNGEHGDYPFGFCLLVWMGGAGAARGLRRGVAARPR